MATADDGAARGLMVARDPKFSIHKSIRTTLFARKPPYIGFTYRDGVKGTSIKGEDVTGLVGAALRAKLGASFLSSKMQPIPTDHVVSMLTEVEIAELGLPAEPAWLQVYR